MFKRPSITERQERRAAEKAANLTALATVPARCLSRGTYEGGTTAAVPKSEPKRNAALLAMAAGRPCLLLVPGCCNHRQDTTVAAHSNAGVHGKSMGRKADDQFSAWSCAACHRWLDQGPAPAAQKEAAFMAAHARQVLAWRVIATDPQEPPRFRRAALWALEHLNATPIGGQACA